MLGLLYKDVYSAKKELLMTLGFVLIFCVFNLVIGQEEMLSPSIGVLLSLGCMVPCYSIHYDKANGWNKFICASPISRGKVVLSKYIAGLVSTAVMNLIVIADNLGLGCPMPAWSYPVFLGLTLLFQAVMIPVCLKLGQNFVVAVFMGMIFVPMALLFGLNRLGVWSDEAIRAAFDFVEQNAGALAPLAALAVAALYVGSFFLTLHFYRKMEF